ncbi:hypothetical protein [Gloeocapsopsis dulcis]|uniref:Uncharacterized protein n=1 Tax=Gloeocapsopsis dulcis AAB1 = 1H9 TaxID=1433147 RepID=A0A6N8FXS2_9CHRO|nr:hypothetical protein [Gloeocapsopsis dulcis]MUL37873.1 hypothetical protein [Gloeocapsopsis dulcis AAB1 = 1H9]WNN92319.1 hypothetical protein P0S91_26040 [Gloeocapsopsis dulcis]
MSYVEFNRVSIPTRLSWQQGCQAIAHGRFWFLLVLSLGTTSNVIYTCTVPLAGFGAIAGATLPRRRALTVIFSMWFINQLLGFTVRQYPWTLSTVAWGPVLLLGAVLAGLLGNQKPAVSQRGFTGYGIWLSIALMVGFVAYQAVIGLASLVLGGIENFTLPIVWDVFVGNMVWAIALIGIHCILIWNARRRKIGIA